MSEKSGRVSRDANRPFILCSLFMRLPSPETAPGNNQSAGLNGRMLGERPPSYHPNDLYVVSDVSRDSKDINIKPFEAICMQMRPVTFVCGGRLMRRLGASSSPAPTGGSARRHVLLSDLARPPARPSDPPPAPPRRPAHRAARPIITAQLESAMFARIEMAN